MTTNCQFEIVGLKPGQLVTFEGIHVICDKCGYNIMNQLVRGIYGGHEVIAGLRHDMVALPFRPVICPDCQKQHTLLSFPCDGGHVMELPIKIELPMSAEQEMVERGS